MDSARLFCGRDTADLRDIALEGEEVIDGRITTKYSAVWEFDRDPGKVGPFDQILGWWVDRDGLLIQEEHRYLDGRGTTSRSYYHSWEETNTIEAPIVPSLTPTPEATATATPTLTPTPAPTATPEPTATPRPSPTPTPTLTPTPSPTPTATPLPTPAATPTPEPNQWEFTGYWSQSPDYEWTINEALDAEGYDGEARVATLDAIPTAWAADVSLSIGCIASLGIAYLTPYSWEVPPSVDTYVIGMWNDKTDSWEDDDLGWYSSPILTDDGSAIYVSNQAQVRQIIRILEKADQNRNPDLVLTAGMFDSNEDGLGLWGEFDPDGLKEVLQYLPCH